MNEAVPENQHACGKTEQKVRGRTRKKALAQNV